MALAYDAAREALDGAPLPLDAVPSMRQRAFEAALDATGGDVSTARSVVQDAVSDHLAGRF